MGILSELKPKKVFEYFELLSSVPHGSGNTKQISDICVNFAKERGLEYYRDNLNNVVIIKPATEGYENSAPIIMQGHLDMVCTKDDDCDIDMANEPIKLTVDGDWVRAIGTSLGGDNIVAVAMIMAVLDSNDLSHPRVEAVFTVDEETGMDGAMGLDVTPLRGKMMLNLDSEEDGVLTCGCAGGARVDCALQARREDIPADFVCAKIVISGLQGGHSGVDIDKGHASSNQLMGRLIYNLAISTDLRLVEMWGGKLDNVIPLYTESVIAFPAADFAKIEALATDFADKFKFEYSTAEPGMEITFEKCDASAKAVSKEDTDTMLFTLLTVPYGVEAMSMDIKGLVQTSLNLGVLKLNETELNFSFATRSSILSQKEMLIQRLTAILERVGGRATVRSSYPGWAYRKDSLLRDTIAEAYKDQSGKDAIISATHGGLECGMFIEKIPGLDCVSIGPDLREVHSTRERLSISSTARLWDLVCDVLKRLK